MKGAALTGVSCLGRQALLGLCKLDEVGRAGARHAPGNGHQPVEGLAVQVLEGRLLRATAAQALQHIAQQSLVLRRTRQGN